MTLLPHEEMNLSGDTEFTVIVLHGLGASGQDFVPLVEHLKLKTDKVRFIFPHAPERPVTVNNGYIMPSWYDIYALDIDRKIDNEQIQLSSDQVHAFIDREIERGIASNHIILAGFSQGGAVAYHAAFHYPKPLGGLLAMSTYFATAEQCPKNDVNAALPICIQHGNQDPVVPEALGQRAVNYLKAQGFEPLYQTYSMQHEVSLPQIQDIADWLNARFEASGRLP